MASAPPPPTPADDAAALAGALPLAPLGAVATGVARAGQAGLEALADDLAGKDDGER